MRIDNIIFDKAIDKRNKDVLNLLLDNADENCVQNGQKRAMMHRIKCCFPDDLDIWKKVLEKLKPDINRYSCKNTELAAVLESTYDNLIYERAKILIDYGAKIDKVDGRDFKLPALQHYLMFQRIYDDRVIDLLISNGANINIVNKNGDNYLICKVNELYDYYGYVELVDIEQTNRLINKYNLNITSANKKGLTLLDFIERGIKELNEDLKSKNSYYSNSCKEKLNNLYDLRSFYISLTGGL